MMTDPELLLLDEPAAGMDLGGREDLVRRLHRLATDPDAPTTVLVTHHVEEIPEGMTHVMLLRDGRVVVRAAPRRGRLGDACPRHSPRRSGSGGAAADSSPAPTTERAERLSG